MTFIGKPTPSLRFSSNYSPVQRFQSFHEILHVCLDINVRKHCMYIYIYRFLILLFSQRISSARFVLFRRSKSHQHRNNPCSHRRPTRRVSLDYTSFGESFLFYFALLCVVFFFQSKISLILYHFLFLLLVVIGTTVRTKFFHFDVQLCLRG
jgi:hypothetical protein